MNKDLTEYEKDLNELKEQILKEGNTLLTKRDLLERFCKIDKEYNGRSWNLLQILANINILIGQEPCEEKQPKMGHWIDADKLEEKIQKYQSIHDSYCDNISKGDAWEGHTTDHYDLSSGKATACDVILGFINELQAESEVKE